MLHSGSNRKPQVEVSILMPIKNALPYLHSCVESILAQSLDSWELIAVDDHSTDGSYQVIQDYAASDPRIISIKNPDHGIIHALRAAFAQSSGTKITRMDADDIMDRNKLRLLAEPLCRHGKGFVSIGKVRYFSDRPLGNGYMRYAQWLNNLTEMRNNFSDLYRECPIPSPCWMLWADDLKRIEAFDHDRYPEDYDLAFRMYLGGLRIVGAKEEIHLWRDHDARSSRTQDHYKDNQFLALKMYYFKKLHFDPKRKLILWGAGRKGKAIALSLLEEKIPFTWICNNDKKWGQKIYNIALENIDVEKHLNQSLCLIAVSNPQEQENILQLFESKKLNSLADYFFFC